eukprot:4296307-Pleurochrysis_carterae.AAC.1
MSLHLVCNPDVVGHCVHASGAPCGSKGGDRGEGLRGGARERQRGKSPAGTHHEDLERRGGGEGREREREAWREREREAWREREREAWPE